MAFFLLVQQYNLGMEEDNTNTDKYLIKINNNNNNNNYYTNTDI